MPRSNPKMHIITLPNGMRCTLIPTAPPMGGKGIVSCAFVYNVGSRDELGIQEGVAHLFEHLFFPESFFKSAHGKGAEINASTSRDRTNFVTTCTEAGLDWLFRAELQRMQHLDLSQEHVQREIQIVCNEGRLHQNATSRAMDVLRRCMFHYGYDHSPSGAESVLHAFTADKAKKWYGAYYNPSRCMVLVSGAFDPGAVEAKLREVFRGIRDSQPPVHRPVVRLKTHQTSVKMHNQHSNMVFLSYKGPKGMTQEAIDLAVLRELMNGSKGWLNTGPWHRAEAVWDRSRDESMFTLVAWISLGGEKKAKRALVRALNRKPTQKEVAQTRRDLATAWSSRGTSRELVEMLSECVALGSVMDCAARVEALNSVSRESLRQVVEAYLRKERCVKLVATEGKEPDEPESTPLPISEVQGASEVPALHPLEDAAQNVKVSFRAGIAYLVEYWHCSEGAACLAQEAYCDSLGGIEREVEPTIGGILVTHTIPPGSSKKDIYAMLQRSLSGDARRARVNRQMENSDNRESVRRVFSNQMPPHFGQHQELPHIPNTFTGKIVKVGYDGPQEIFRWIQTLRRWKCPDPTYPKPQNSKGKIHEKKTNAEATWVRMGWLVDYAEEDPRYPALKVSVAKLGLGMLCDVMQTLRVEKKLTYTAAAFCQPVGSSTMVVASASFSKGMYKDGLREMKRVVAKWLEGDIDATWAQECANHHLLQMDGFKQRLKAHMFPFNDKRVITSMRHVSDQDIRAALSSLSMENLTIVSVGPLT